MCFLNYTSTCFFISIFYCTDEEETTTEATEAADEGKSSPQFTCDFDPGKMPTSYCKKMIFELRDRDDIPLLLEG
jgi:hypothetical protein